MSRRALVEQNWRFRSARQASFMNVCEITPFRRRYRPTASSSSQIARWALIKQSSSWLDKCLNYQTCFILQAFIQLALPASSTSDRRQKSRILIEWAYPIWCPRMEESLNIRGKIWSAKIYVWCWKFRMQVVLVYLRPFWHNSLIGKCASAKNCETLSVVQDHRCWYFWKAR